MGLINTLLDKVNQANSALETTKGIKSKIAGFTKDSANFVDELKEQAAESERTLQKRRASLEKSVDAANSSKKFATQTASSSFVEIQYPLQDGLENFIVFRTRPRKKRDGENGRNLLSDESVEIALYVPDALISTANVGYKAEGVGTFTRGALAVFDRGMSVEALKQAGEEIVNVAGTAINKMINAATGDVVNFVQGQAVNPMQEQMLDGVGFRSFNFEYQFWPKTPDEANMVQQIIYYFRTAMLPDTFGAADESEAETFFNYPNIFDVEFEGPVKDTVDGFLPMVCTKCDVDHFGGTKFATFYDGQPIHTNMSLSFTEIKILTQETYNQIASGKKFSKFANDDIGGGSVGLLDRSTAGGDG